MTLRDKIIDEIMDIASDILVIPLSSFLRSNCVTGTIKYYGPNQGNNLKKLIELIYKNAESINLNSFKEFSLEDVREIHSMISKINANIKYLKDFNQYNHEYTEVEARKLFEVISSYSKDLDDKLQSDLPKKNQLDDDIKLVQKISIYTKLDRERATKEIKMLIDEQLRTPVNELLNSGTVRTLIRRIEKKSMGNHDSSDIVLEVLERSYAVLWIISTCSLIYFSNSAFKIILENTCKLVDLLRKIKALKHESESDNSDKAEELLLQCNNWLASLTGEINICMTYLMHEVIIKPDLLPTLEKFKELEMGAGKMIDNLKSDLALLEKKNIEIEKTMLELKKIASSLGTKSLTGIFASRSNELDAKSKVWLWAAIGMAVLSIIVAIVLLVSGNADGDTTSEFSKIPLRIVILGILISATLWCGRNYRSLRHQSVANAEREDILSTFRSFVEGAHDKKVQDIVLAEAVRSVFTPSPSGFVDNSAGRDSRGTFNLTNSGNFDKLGKGD